MFQLVFHCLMVIMFSLKQAALLFSQLLQTTYVFAATATAGHYDVLVSRGDSVLLTCNISNKNATLINWTKDRWVFMYSFSSNQTFSNFSSHRLRIDTNIPSTLGIDNAQHDDAGLYTCHITQKKGLHNMSWNVTVPENQNGASSPQYIIFTLPSAFGLFLCCSALTVCLCRKYGTRKERRKPVQHQTQLQLGGQEVHDQLEGTGQWRSKKHRRDYMERLNSVYGQV
ncbi:uncharacterized protein LOC103459550 [Poecilia reticulata]|uniref:uncharacterized protein LOC103459550 n=1 Tax=Poecilia reticulata TaxID=8081 RepID=UPI0004A46382|nr:PREDICTED: uncharacterized protein LOC103459550 [Poecilia reticulata]